MFKWTKCDKRKCKRTYKTRTSYGSKEKEQNMKGQKRLKMSHRIVFTKLIFNEEDKVDKWKIVNFLRFMKLWFTNLKFSHFHLKLGSFKMIFYWITKMFLYFPAVIRLNCTGEMDVVEMMWILFPPNETAQNKNNLLFNLQLG